MLQRLNHRFQRIALFTVLLLGMAFALPNFLSPAQRAKLPALMPQQTMPLGLDLLGGVRLALSLDDAALARQLWQERLEILQQESSHKFMARAQIEGQSAFFRGASEKEALHAAALLMQSFATDVENGTLQLSRQKNIVRAHLSDAFIEQQKEPFLAHATETLQRRMKALSASGRVKRLGKGHISVEILGLEQADALKHLIAKPAQFHAAFVVDGADAARYEKAPVPVHTKRVYHEESVHGEKLRVPVLVESQAVLRAEDISAIRTGRDAERHQPAVLMELREKSLRTLQHMTAENLGRKLAFMVDDIAYAMPTLTEPFTNRTLLISAPFEAQEAQALAALLRAGQLRVPLQLEEERTVAPTFGASSFHAGVKALLFGYALVALLMVVFYRAFGFIAALALALNVVLVIGGATFFAIPLTVYGLAALVLTIGMAVDINILLFERVRDVYVKTQDRRRALREGFGSLYALIWDYNMTGLLAAAVLLAFGNETLHSFAMLLMLGILCSFLTSYALTWYLMRWWFLKQEKPVTSLQSSAQNEGK